MQRESDKVEAPTGGLLVRLSIPAGIIVFCAVAFWLSTQFERVPPILKRGIQPSDFPQLILALIAILAVALMVTDTSDAPEKITPMTWKTVGLMVCFLILAEVDLFLGLGAFAAALCCLWGERRIRVMAALGIIMPLTVFFFFDLIFEIRFPRGLLTNLWYG